MHPNVGAKTHVQFTEINGNENEIELEHLNTVASTKTKLSLYCYKKNV